jgi:hypothetical protein
MVLFAATAFYGLIYAFSSTRPLSLWLALGVFVTGVAGAALASRERGERQGRDSSDDDATDGG